MAVLADEPAEVVAMLVLNTKHRVIAYSRSQLRHGICDGVSRDQAVGVNCRPANTTIVDM